MIGALALIVFLFFVSKGILDRLGKKFSFFNVNLMQQLFIYHYVFWFCYYLYATYNPSDANSYYYRLANTRHEWLILCIPGTSFIEFVGYPFVTMMGFSFEMIMALFSWFGYWGFVCFYIFFKENIKFKHTIYGYDWIVILLFLPNMHFWTNSLGKGSTIFLGIGFFTYAITKLNKRKAWLIAGLTIIYFVRPHVFLFMVLGLVIGIFTGKQKIPTYQKILVFGGGILMTALLADKIFAYLKIDQDNIVESFDKLTSSRATSLADAGSGVDISNYPLPLKLFTFWFRPLFVDSPGFLGLFISCENLLYLALFANVFKKGILKFIRKADSIVKACIIIFLASSFALSTTMSNLGIIIRQKSMVMYFLFFFVLAFMDYQKMQVYIKKKKALERKRKHEELQAITSTDQ